MKFKFLIGAAVVAAIAMAIAIRSYEPDNLGKSQVQEGTALLKQLPELVEPFYKEHGRAPNIIELPTLKTSGASVATLTGSNPYLVTMKSQGLYADVAGKTLGWKYDPVKNAWDECSIGTLDMKFKSLKCRSESKS